MILTKWRDQQKRSGREWWQRIRQKPAPFQELQNNEHTDTLGPIIWAVKQGCTNSVCQFSVATIGYTVESDICGFSVWNVLHVTLLLPTITRRILRFSTFVFYCCKIGCLMHYWSNLNMFHSCKLVLEGQILVGTSSWPRNSGARRLS
jgi:hypothetical protein